VTDNQPLTFARLHEANVRRCQAPRPQGFQHPLNDWSPLEWAGAMCGEAGEAANKAKKLRRVTSYGPEVARELNKGEDIDPKQAGIEAADAVIYADLFAARLGLTLEDLIRLAFNDKSREIGSDIFI